MAREIIGISVSALLRSPNTRILRFPHYHADWSGKIPSLLATRRLLANDAWNRLAIKSEKTFGRPFSKNTALETTGYASYLPPPPFRCRSASAELSLRVCLSFNSCTSGMIHNRSNEYVIPSAPVVPILHQETGGKTLTCAHFIQVGVYFSEVDHGDKIKYVPRSVQIDLEDGVLSRVSSRFSFWDKCPLFFFFSRFPAPFVRLM